MSHMGMGGMDGAGMSMKPYLHFTPGDMLWFMAWTPSSSGAVFGACFGLFLISISERLLNAIRVIMAVEWEKRARLAKSVNDSAAPLPTIAQAQQIEPKPSPSPDPSARPAQSVRSIRNHIRQLPFIPAHDLSRGVLFALQSTFVYLLMLAVMTFNAPFILSIVIGLGVGETLFGRFAAVAPGAGH
ncbi:Ctr copper transporter [Cantharellus anzutake]|uniref:Ctr copper transporter n=1 Tax=Cantharellus anzutake TaxID=1750568 RepID=UPI001908DC94|nr:Ctr copper transporter [Cantharellus anzutake]KAF8338274.1 Ctr copper transporter [Cantharellus anzutake]